MTCPICRSSAIRVGAHGEFPILRCRAPDCGFRFFDLEKWRSPYDEKDYYTDLRTQDLRPDGSWIKARVDIVRRFKPHGTVAELGCGIGETALAFANAGYQVTGVEESKAATDFLRKEYPTVDWRNEDVLGFLDNKPYLYDVATMFHVLEHIPEPKRVVEKLVAALKPDGIAVIEVPDASGGWARLKGAKWDLCVDHHVNYFDMRSLRRLFGLYGFRLVYRQPTYHFSHPQGDFLKDVVKGTLAWLGLNAIVRTVWTR